LHALHYCNFSRDCWSPNMKLYWLFIGFCLFNVLRWVVIIVIGIFPTFAFLLLLILSIAVGDLIADVLFIWPVLDGIFSPSRPDKWLFFGILFSVYGAIIGAVSSVFEELLNRDDQYDDPNRASQASRYRMLEIFIYGDYDRRNEVIIYSMLGSILVGLVGFLFSIWFSRVTSNSLSSPDQSILVGFVVGFVIGFHMKFIPPKIESDIVDVLDVFEIFTDSVDVALFVLIFNLINIGLTPMVIVLAIIALVSTAAGMITGISLARPLRDGMTVLVDMRDYLRVMFVPVFWFTSGYFIIVGGFAIYFTWVHRSYQVLFTKAENAGLLEFMYFSWMTVSTLGYSPIQTKHCQNRIPHIN
jgi:hypothetical protein